MPVTRFDTKQQRWQIEVGKFYLTLLTTGTFTVPPDRFYYFSDEWGRYDLELNGEVTFSIDLDQEESLADEG